MREDVWYAYLVGPVAITVRYWEEVGAEADAEVEGGARVEVRRVEAATGRAHRRGAEGFTVLPVAEGGLWRADLFTRVDPPDGESRYHHHPSFRDDDVGERDFDEAMAADPVGWTLERLADLRGLLAASGAEDLAAQVDAEALERMLPAIGEAVHACLDLRPQGAQ